jgi:hypothetical protein
MEMSGQIQVPAALPAGKNLVLVEQEIGRVQRQPGCFQTEEKPIVLKTEMVLFQLLFRCQISVTLHI